MKNLKTSDVYTGGEGNFFQARIRVGGVRASKLRCHCSESRKNLGFSANWSPSYRRRKTGVRGSNNGNRVVLSANCCVAGKQLKCRENASFLRFVAKD